MSKPIFYQKTPKGIAEIANNSGDLPRRWRTALILIDGQTAHQDLLEKLAIFCDAELVIEQLCAAGLVQVPYEEPVLEVEADVSYFMLVE